MQVLIFVKPEEVPTPTVDGAVEVGTKTEVEVTSTAHDVRPGRSSTMNGCGIEGGDGCDGALTRDGVHDDIESRWSCAPKLVTGGGACQIVYTFAEPQDIVDIQVAFRKANERVRTLQVRRFRTMVVWCRHDLIRTAERDMATLGRRGRTQGVRLPFRKRFRDLPTV